MEKLEEAFNARNKKINKIEKIKDLKTPQSVIDNLKTICENGYENLDSNDSKYFLKCYGIYDKGENSFMIRVRVAAGQLNYEQAQMIGKLALEYGDDYIDITTRQQIELRYLKLENLYTVLTSLESVGITTYQTGVDNLRNIVTDALDNISHDGVIHTFPLVEKLQNIFMKNNDYISTLPRKFNTAILGSATNTCNIFGHDCCFVLASKDGEYGFNVYLGGRVGMQAKCANIFVTEDTIELFFTTLLQLFKEFGFRDNRNKNRLVFLIQAVGMEVFVSTLKQKAKYEFQTAGVNLVSSKSLAVGNKIFQKDNKISKKIIVAAGITSGSDFIDISNAAKIHANGDLRLSYDQNIYIINIDKNKYHSLETNETIKKYSAYDNIYFNDMIACAGTKTCSFAVIPNKSDAIEMATYLQNEIPLDNAKVRMNWSACIKGCGIHGIADIGFEGCKAKDRDGNNCDGVHILLGGKITTQSKEASFFIKSLLITRAKFYVKYLLLAYSELKNINESFEEFETRILNQYSKQSLVFYCMINYLLEINNLELFKLNNNIHTAKNEGFEIFDFGVKLYRLLTNETRYSHIIDFNPTLKNDIKADTISQINKDVPKYINDIIYKMTQFNKIKRYQVFSEIIEDIKELNV
jgi:ferredoxin-nitrite reductase